MSVAPFALRVRGFSRCAIVLLSCSVCVFACSAGPSAARGAAAGGTAPVAQTHPPGQATQRAPDAGKPAADSGNALPPKSASGAAGSAGMATAGAAGARTPQAGSSANAGPRDTQIRDAAISEAECQRCTEYALPMTTGTVEPAELSALSGLAFSRSQPEILFTHNDHDRPVVYALDLQGRLHARLTLQGAQTSDIEDIAVGKCDAETCVYLADVGDNAAQREQYSILRFATPEVPSTPSDMQLTPSFKQLHFRYEDGSHNAESLMVAPNGNLYIITKLAPGSGGSVEATGPSSVYRIVGEAFARDAVAVAQKVSTLSVPQRGEPALSAAAAHPCGLGFLVRTYDRVYEFLVPLGAEFEAAFAATPAVVAMPDEPQSEGIDYLPDGRGFVTSGEGASAPILRTQCAP